MWGCRTVARSECDISPSQQRRSAQTRSAQTRSGQELVGPKSRIQRLHFYFLARLAGEQFRRGPGLTSEASPFHELQRGAIVLFGGLQTPAESSTHQHTNAFQNSVVSQGATSCTAVAIPSIGITSIFEEGYKMKQLGSTQHGFTITAAVSYPLEN